MSKFSWGLSGLMFLILAAHCHAAEVAFKQKPEVRSTNGVVSVHFSVASATDVEVAAIDATGNVVRHLAAGVLGGPAAPPTPLRAGLDQTLQWDLKDDFGKPAVGGPFTLRVRAGTGVKFAGYIGAETYLFGQVDSIASDETGKLYVLGSDGPANQKQKTLRVFSPDGKYLRTILPFSADVKHGSMKDVGEWDEKSQTWRPRNLSILNPEFYAGGGDRSPYSMVSVSTKNGILFAHPEGIYRLNIDGTVAGESFATKQIAFPKRTDNALGYHLGPIFYTASPDGKWLYLSGPFPQKDRAKPDCPPGQVWRMRLDGTGVMEPFVVLKAELEGPWSKPPRNAYGTTGPVHGIAVDAAGNVYIADRGHDRVAVFSEAGKELGQIDIQGADQICINPQSHAIYVLTRHTTGWITHDTSLLKFANYEKGALPVATYVFHKETNFPKMTLSMAGAKAVLWVAGAAEPATNIPGKRPLSARDILALEDADKEFHVKPVPHANPDALDTFARIVADPVRDEIYISDGVNKMWRFDGRTGEGASLSRDGKLFNAVDLAVGYDGLLYVRSGDGYSGPLERLTRDLKPVPYPETGTNVIYNIYGRYGIGYCEKGIGPGPDGKIYENWMYSFAKYFVTGFGADGKPLKGQYMAEKLKTEFKSQDKKAAADRQVETAVVGPVPSESAGVRVDLQGNLYLGMRVLPKGFTAPEGFTKDPAYLGFTGSVVKMPATGGAVLGITDSESANPAAPRIETNKPKVVIEGATQLYPGIAPFAGAGFGGNTSCCVCRVSRFDLDRYGRLALPNVVTTSVTLLDNAGNKILEFGQYGNFDSQYIPTGSDKPIVSVPSIPMAWPTGAAFTEKAIYVVDTYNRRVIRADYTHAVEEVCRVP